VKNYKKKYYDYNAYVLEPQYVDQVREDDNNERNKCLYCYDWIDSSNSDFHEACNKKFFGQLETPSIGYNKNELEKLAEKILYSQQTVTGVQAKISLSLNRSEEKNKAKKLTIVGLYGDYILKPPSDYYPQLPEVEHLTMYLAKVCGLNTVPHSLVHLQDGTACYITKRVDRKKNQKLHMLDMCQVTERLTEDKYKGSHEQIAKTILKYSANPMLDVTNFYELVLFSYLIGNADMHLKNFSFLEDAAIGFLLSPAYDLLSTTLVNPADTEELALTLNGKKKKLKYADFLSAFENCGLSKKLLDATLTNFYYCTKEIKFHIQKSFLSQEFKAQLIELFMARCGNLFKDADLNLLHEK
jgi:serine/threonine-protein kinase HipA